MFLHSLHYLMLGASDFYGFLRKDFWISKGIFIDLEQKKSEEVFLLQESLSCGRCLLTVDTFDRAYLIILSSLLFFDSICCPLFI